MFSILYLTNVIYYLPFLKGIHGGIIEFGLQFSLILIIACVLNEIKELNWLKIISTIFLLFILISYFVGVKFNYLFPSVLYYDEHPLYNELSNISDFLKAKPFSRVAVDLNTDFFPVGFLGINKIMTNGMTNTYPPGIAEPSINYSFDLGKPFSRCDELFNLSEKTGTGFYLALSDEYKRFLRGCSLNETVYHNFSLFYYKDISISSGCDVININNTEIILNSSGRCELKVNYFPRWRGADITNNKPFIALNKEGLVKINYEPHLFDYIGWSLTVIGLTLLFA